MDSLTLHIHLLFLRKILARSLLEPMAMRAEPGLSSIYPVTFVGAAIALSLALWLMASCSATSQPVLGEASVQSTEKCPTSPPPAFAPTSLGTESLVAHAGGGVRGLAYTNSLESLQINYKRGFRLFELDMELTRDKHLVFIHDWGLSAHCYRYGEVKPSSQRKWNPSRRQFERTLRADELTTPTLGEVGAWLKTHPDARIIVDLKADRMYSLRYLSDHVDSHGQFIPELGTESEVAFARDLGFNEVILDWGRFEGTADGFTAAAQRMQESLFAVAFPLDHVLRNPLPKSLKQLGFKVLTYTTNLESEAVAALSAGASGIYTDSLMPALNVRPTSLVTR